MKICCPHCLVPFESAEETSWSGIACPTCGNSFSLSGTETTCSFQPGVQVMGRFELLEVVGNGRFGSVWKARDTQLQRMVAVKIPRQGKLNPQETELFLRDARAAAQLRHPRIAGVHEVGREFDTVYIVSDFIDGANLAEWLSGRRLSAEESAEIVIQIAEALHHAHEKGVVHRDVKPGNIMMDRSGLPHVIDFGLARREVGEMTVTVEGQVLGTPAYMPPEQARGEGHRADRRSDIYSVGAILFKLLTGELPFRGDARMLLIQILDEEPPSPRKLNASVPRDLETITLKCLEKDPAKRYKTARDLADDLKRFLAGEPILARPVGYLERAWRWSKRHTAVATLSASLLLLLLTMAVVAPIVAVHQARLRREADARLLDFQNQVAQNRFQSATEEFDAGRTARGIALLASAYDLMGAKNPLRDSIRRMMAGWSRQNGLPLVQDDAVVAVAINLDGRTAIIGGHSPVKPAQLWDIRTMSPIGPPLQHAKSVRAVAFSPDGSLAFTGSEDGTARFWDAHTGAPAGKPLRHGAQIWSVAFSPDGKVAVTGAQDDRARLWDVATGDPIGKPLKHDGAVLAIAFSPAGDQLLTGDYDGKARLWDVKTHELIEEPFLVGPPPGNEEENIKPVYAVGFTHDGKRLFTGCADKVARFWDAETLKPVGEPLRHDHTVYAAVLDHGAKTLLTSSMDNSARLWDPVSARAKGSPLRHNDWVMSAAFSPDDRIILTGSPDRTARLWLIQESQILAHDGDVLAFAFSPKGDVVVTGGEDKQARIWSASDGRALHNPLPHDSRVTAVALSSDGRIVFTGTESGELCRWKVETGMPVDTPWKIDGEVAQIDHHQPGDVLIVRYSNEKGSGLQIRDTATGAERSKPLYFDLSKLNEPFVFVISPGGKMATIKDQNESARIWDLATGEPKGSELVHVKRIADAAFSPDGRVVVTGGFDQHLRTWDTDTGMPVGKPIRNGGIVRDVAFSNGGKTIISGSSDHTARMVDWQTGASRGEPLQHHDEVVKVALSPDDSTALTICRDGTAFLWDVAVRKKMARPLQYEVGVNDGKFDQAGTQIVFSCKDGSVRLYKIPTRLPNDAKFIRAWSRMQTGFESDGEGALRQLSQAEWQKAQTEVASFDRLK